MTRRTTVLVGVALIAAYVASAALAGHLSLLARGPLLDDSAPLQPYRWVNPPPDLAPTNVAPSSAAADLPLGPKGNQTLNLVTSDSQMILVLSAGVIPPHGSDTKARVDITPIDPATLSPIDHGLSAFGNAYQVTGTYLPSKTTVTTLHGTLDVVLVYPVTANLFAHKHTVLFSPKASSWLPLKSTDLFSMQQVEAQPPGMGYVLVGGVKGPNPISPSPVSNTGASSPLAISLMVGAAAALLVGFALVLRNSRRR